MNGVSANKSFKILMLIIISEKNRERSLLGGNTFQLDTNISKH